MSDKFYILVLLLCMIFAIVAYFGGYVHGRVSEGKPIEINPVIKKKKPPDSKIEAQRKEYNRQLYNIEHYTGSSDGMLRKGGD